MQKAMQRLKASGRQATPSAYFESFYEIAKIEGISQVDELNWQKKWLKHFDKDTQTALSKANSPDEFITMLAKILESTKQTCSIAHTNALKGLVSRLLDMIEDVFSISARNKFHFLFRATWLNSADSVSKLNAYWSKFQESGTHIAVMKKIATILAAELRKVDSKEALDLSTSLVMNPERLGEMRVLDKIAKLLNVEEAKITHTSLDDTNIVIFKLGHLRFFEPESGAESKPNSDVDISSVSARALEILEQICKDGLDSSNAPIRFENGFAFVFRGLSKEALLKEIVPITLQIEAQKFSYKGVMFAFSFNTQVLEGRAYDSFEDLKKALGLQALQNNGG